MTRLLAGLVLVVLVCRAAAGLCSAGLGCSTHEPLGLTAALILSVAGAILVIWLSLAALSLVQTQRAFRRLPRVVPTGRAARAARQLGLEGLVCVDTDAPVAFCVGALRPQIVISRGTVTRLSRRGLVAVLAHEASHQRTREPLLRALRAAASHAMFGLPLLRWWAEDCVVRSELAADRAGAAVAGSDALAGALVVLGNSASAPLFAAFGGPLDLRAAQILGDRLPPRRPGATVWASSMLRLATIGIAIFCAADVLALLWSAT